MKTTKFLFTILLLLSSPGVVKAQQTWQQQNTIQLQNGLDYLSNQKAYSRSSSDPSRSSSNPSRSSSDPSWTRHDDEIVKQFMDKISSGLKKYFDNRQWAVGNKLTEYEKWRDSLELIRDFSNLPKNFWAFRDSAFVYEDLQQYDKAIKNYTSIISILPDYDRYWFKRADLFRTENHYEEAISDYLKYISLKKHKIHGYVYEGIADCYMQLNQIEDANDNYLRAIDSYSDYINVSLGLSDDFNYLDGKYDTEKYFGYRAGLFKKIGFKKNYENDSILIFKLRSKPAKMHLYKAEVLKQTHEFEKAIDAYSSAILLDTLDSDAYFGRGQVKIQIYDTLSGRRDIEKSIKMGNIDAKRYYSEHWR